ncbi:MAG: hypothetical protein U9N85_12250 [Bacteroidota bacterium]|nr:hypothetical protein [Bacteroidota bacterium]
MKNKLIPLLVLTVCLPFYSQAQINTQQFPESYSNLSWGEFAKKAEADFDIKFYTLSDSLSRLKTTFSTSQENGTQQLIRFLESNGLALTIKDNIFIITQNQKIETQLPPEFFLTKHYNFDSNSANNKNYLSKPAKYIAKRKTVGSADADKKKYATVRAFIKNPEDQSAIPNAAVKVLETGKTVVSNHNGVFSLTLAKGTYSLNITSIEIEETDVELELLSDGEMTIYPERRFVAMDEILISSDKFHNVRSSSMGFEKLSMNRIEEIPSSIGEKDIIKAGLLLPGIQSVGEGNSGFNVRGSPADQNMFYLDDIPLYNTSHFLGFFSSFNSAAIGGFTLYKNTIPDEFTASLSSIFDIQAQEGDMQKFSAGGGISPVSANFLIETPIVKDKVSILAGLRTSYSDWIFKLFDNHFLNESNAKFKDAIANITIQPNNSDKFKFLSYYSSDNSNLAGNYTYNYNTLGNALKWEKTINKKHRLNTGLTQSKYSYTEINTHEPLYGYAVPFELIHTEFKSNISLHLADKHKLQFGVNSILYQLDQDTVRAYGEQSLTRETPLFKEQSVLSGVFVSEEWKATDNLTLHAGFRYNYYANLGPAHVGIYEQNKPINPKNRIGYEDYAAREIITSYFHPDIRFSANYMINGNTSVKVGMNYMYQYIFMMSNTIAASPTSKWKLSDKYLSPMHGLQYSVGFYTNFSENNYEFSVEGYYKDITNYKDYKNGANIAFSQTPETELLEGDLNSYGVELMLKKTRGKLNGWINYTYSKAMVYTANNHSDDQINFGEPYPANYDKPHALNFVGNYKFGRRLSLSSNIVYSTGRPVTFPTGVYHLNNIQILNYSKRNEYRVPDYFRIDLSVKVEGNLKSNKFAHGTWLVSIYNLTGRDNTYSVFFKTEEGVTQSYKMSIFAVPIFSISYQFKLGNYADKH